VAAAISLKAAGVGIDTGLRLGVRSSCGRQRGGCNANQERAHEARSASTAAPAMRLKKRDRDEGRRRVTNARISTPEAYVNGLARCLAPQVDAALEIVNICWEMYKCHDEIGDNG
jgi:hypothetical protein